MTEDITRISRNAALSVKGVAAVTPPMDVFVAKKKDKFDVDIYLAVYFGIKIPEIAWNVQEKVHESLEAEGITNVEHINIHIQGVKNTEGK